MKSAEIQALQAELNAGRDPFNPSYDAGVSDGFNARLYKESFRPNRHNEDDYKRGFETVRALKLGFAK